MISNQFNKGVQWLQERPLREQIFVSLLGFIVIYVLWHLILMRSLSATRKQLDAQVLSLQSDLTATLTEFNKLSAISHQGNLRQQQEILSAQALETKKNLDKILDTQTNATILPQIINKILTYQPSGVMLVDMKTSAPTPWLTPDLQTALPQLQGVNQYPFQINFRSGYFGAIAYLKFFEKLPGYIYWDTLSYVVTQYPQGNVTIKFYVVGK